MSPTWASAMDAAAKECRKDTGLSPGTDQAIALETGFVAGADFGRASMLSELEAAREIAKECYEEAYAYELEYPSTPWSRLLFRVAKALTGEEK